MTPGNLFAQIPADLSREVFQTLAGKAGVKIERIISCGQSSPASGWYDQAQDEWVMVLRGAATIGFEDGSEVDLAAGDYLNIPARRRHRVTRTSADPETIWLAVHY